MSEVLAQLEKKGGGDLKETILWSNPTPTSNFAGGYGTDFSESIESFKYIKIYFRISTSNATEGSVIYEKDVFKTLTGATTTGLCGSMFSRVGSNNYFRRITYTSDTNMMFYDAVQVGSASSNSYLIPLKVCGLK